MNILKKPEICKGWLGIAIITAVLTFLATVVAIGGFALHQLAKLELPMTIEDPPALPPLPIASGPVICRGGTTTPAIAVPAPKLFVASKRGKTYYYPWCTGATTIPEANKMWFPSRMAAEAAGYTPAKSCKDLSQ